MPFFREADFYRPDSVVSKIWRSEGTRTRGLLGDGEAF